MALLTNIIGYWKLDEASGNASDSVAGNTLTNNNSVTYGAGKINNGALFGSTNTNKSLTNSVDLISSSSMNVTMTCWLNVTTAPTSGIQDLFYGISGLAGVLGYIMVYVNVSGTLTLRVTRVQWNVGQADVDNAQTFTVGTWYHVAYTWDGLTLTAYVNGSALATTGTQTGAGSGNRGTCVSLGALVSTNGSPNLSQNFSPVSIDEVGLWSRALSSTEISQLYNGGVGLSYPFSTSNNSAFFFATR